MKIKVTNTRGGWETYDFPRIPGVDMYRFLTYFDCPVRRDGRWLVFPSEGVYHTWYFRMRAYQSALHQLETVRDVDPAFVSRLIEAGEEYLGRGDLPGWLRFIDYWMNKWVWDTITPLVEEEK